MADQFFSNSQFGLWRKWFWIGVVAAIFNPVVGLVYGIALAVEEDRRKEGVIIVVFAVAWFVFAAFLLIPWLIKSGIMPHYRLLQMK